ncbi:LiaF domain-containing protein, partial [Jiangella rhizosphaerae]
AAVAPAGGAAPAGGVAQPPLPPSDGPVRPAERITSVLSNEKRRGRWEVPARIDVTSILGEVVLDFTEAVVRTPEVEIQTAIVLGSLTLIVPEGIDVRLDEGTNILGERKMKLREPVTPGAPVYRVRGFVLLGEVTVRPPRDKRRSLLGH